MTYEWAKPGVKVVCINDTYIHGLLKEGEVYEIHSTCIKSGNYFMGVLQENSLNLKLVGFKDEYLIDIPNDPRKVYGFNIKRFRPLITKDDSPAERSSKKLPDSLTILLEKPNRLIVPSGDSYDRRDGGKWDVKPREKVKVR